MGYKSKKIHNSLIRLGSHVAAQLIPNLEMIKASDSSLDNSSLAFV